MQTVYEQGDVRIMIGVDTSGVHSTYETHTIEK